MGARSRGQGFKGCPGLSAASQGDWGADGAMQTRGHREPGSAGAGIGGVGIGSSYVL